MFNNLWGFWKSLWLNLDLRIGAYQPMIRHGLRLMLIPLTIDLIASLPLAWMIFSDAVFIITYYATAACYLIAIAFFWALQVPRKITSTFQLRGSTSPLSVVAAMGGLGLLSLIQLNRWFYLLVLVLLALGLMALWYSQKAYKEKKYIISDKLMKE